MRGWTGWTGGLEAGMAKYLASEYCADIQRTIIGRRLPEEHAAAAKT